MIVGGGTAVDDVGYKAHQNAKKDRECDLCLGNVFYKLGLLSKRH